MAKAKQPEVLRANITNFIAEGIQLLDTIKTLDDLLSEDKCKKFAAMQRRWNLTEDDTAAFGSLAYHLVPATANNLTLKNVRKMYASLYTLLTGREI